MRLKILLIVISVAAMSIQTKPTFKASQQSENCDTLKTNGKEATALEKCLCERKNSNQNPTYQIAEMPYGMKPVATKSSNRKGGGAASSRGAVEKMREAKLLGMLEIPNSDDSNSPEVAGLREELRNMREKKKQTVEQYWKGFNKPRMRQKRLPCKPPAQDCEPEYKSVPLPLCAGYHCFSTQKKLGEHKAEVVRAYNQYQNLQNTSDWYRLPKFDWRERGLDVGQVMDQGSCGSCWAFASVSTYQSAWNLEQMRLGKGFLDLVVPYSGVFKRQPSVQQLLNCIGKEKGDCGRGWHGAAFEFMVDSHVPHIPDRLVWNKPDTASIEEYTGRESICTDPLRNRKVKRGGIPFMPTAGPDSRPRLIPNSDLTLTASDRALAWDYVNEPFDDMPSVEKLKSAVVERGPLAVSIVNDHCFGVYKSGIFNGKSGNRAVNHIVVLIGWDDSKKAWLIKNSWGKNWGEEGFAWVEYESNSVGLYAAWIQPSPINAEMPPELP